MRHQQKLSTFTDTSGARDHSRQVEDSDTTLTPPSQYPQKAIRAQQTEKATYKLCIPGGKTVTTTFAMVAGCGGMGPATGITNPDKILSVTQQLTGTPVILNGGGMNVAGGGGKLFAQLLNSELTDINTATSNKNPPQSVRLTLKPLYRRHRRVRQDTQSRILGSYTLSVPASHADATKASQALSAWSNDAIEYLFSQFQTAANQSKKLTQTLDDLAPGDTLKTPSYETPLTIISEQYQAHVRISRVTGEDKLKSVSSFTVDNPYGGSYQFGFRDNTRGTDPPICYLGCSRSTPPMPNTSFRCNSQFSATDIEVDSSPNDELPEQIVKPDKDIQQSPLPKPCLRTSLRDIDGVGPKTTRKVFLQLKTTDAHELAYNLYGEGTEIPEANIVRALDGLPSKSAVLDQLKKLAADIT